MVSLDDSASDATFYLLTSDAERVAVDTHLLASNSTVFKDLLEIGSAEGGNKTCKVAETVQEIRLLVKTLETSKIDDRSADTLKVLARLGDKYDIRKVVSALQEELVYAGSLIPCWLSLNEALRRFAGAFCRPRPFSSAPWPRKRE